MMTTEMAAWMILYQSLLSFDFHSINCHKGLYYLTLLSWFCYLVRM